MIEAFNDPVSTIAPYVSAGWLPEAFSRQLFFDTIYGDPKVNRHLVAFVGLDVFC
jgi:hypothetical protein